MVFTPADIDEEENTTVPQENAPTPMMIDDDNSAESVVQDNAGQENQSSSEVEFHINTKPVEVIESAKAHYENMQKKSTILFANYVHLVEQHPDSGETAAAQEAYQDYEEKLKAFKKTLDSYTALNSTPVPIPVATTAATPVSTVVPPTLPALQLRTDSTLWKPKQEAFDSVLDFCISFEKVLRAHSLGFDHNWERLLPLCLNNTSNSWCIEKLLGQHYSWEFAKSKLLDHFDTPYRKFLLMAQVGCLRQGKTETTRDYSERFQKLRRQAGFEDGIQLVVTFYVSLRYSVRMASRSAIASQYGSKLPTSIDDMVDLVCAAGEDSTFLLSPESSSSGNSRNSNHNSSDLKRRKPHGHDNVNGSSNGAGKPPHKKFASDSSVRNEPCKWCKKPWQYGHRCKEYYEFKKDLIKQNKIKTVSKNELTSRMARRTPQNSADNIEHNDHHEIDQDEMAVDCKYPKNKKVPKEFSRTNTNITFPVLVNDRKSFALLDCGADFSSIDINYCIENNIKINYYNKDFVNKYKIKLGDKYVSTDRIGYSLISVKCNNKNVTRNFEVMNLSGPNDIFSISVGTDYMKLFGIGVTGLPITYDDLESYNKLAEASKRFDKKSELLESLEIENKKLENSPACTELEFEKAMSFIQPFLDKNQAIPKGSFCTIPESVVHLKTPPNVSAYRNPYPIPFIYREIVDEQIQEWLDNGFIKRATGNIEWNSPLTVVKKTNSKGEITGYRVCHDPRHINILLQSIDRMPLPIIHELFEELQGANVYSTLDLKSAFNSLKLYEPDAHKLSFTWRGVQYTPIATMFGIKHVSSQFQRTMSIALEGLPCKFFVDDVVVTGRNLEEHKQNLKQVVERLTSVNLKLNPKKCKFFQSKIYLLGFHVSPNGISMDRRKLVNVIDFPQPKTGKDIQRYTGLINYFRSLIPNVSTIMAPLDKLRNAKSLEKIWLPEHQKAFDNLKQALMSDLILSYPDLNQPFCIATDASNVGIGVVLYQVIDGNIKYISMMAKSLSKSERNYSTTKRELLAVVYALQKFHKYIYGSHFTLYTDHLALCYLHTQKIANIMLINWLDIILQYDFDIVHLPGIKNILPDALSRLFEDHTLPIKPANELVGDKNVMHNRKATKHNVNESTVEVVKDDFLTPPHEDRQLLLLREHTKGHFGSDAIYHSLRRQGIYWTNLKNEAVDLVKHCVQCQKHNIVQKGYNPLRPLVSSLPGDSWGIDLAGPFTTSTRGNNYLLVMIDHATKYCILEPIPDKSAVTIAKIVADVICDKGPFRKLVSDNGTEFVNEIMSTLKNSLGFEHALISTYHPRSNGASERTVQSAVKVIKKFVNGNKADWDIFVKPAQLFMNCKYNERTKTPPFTLMYGRNANDFIDYSQEKEEATRKEINADLQSKVSEMQTVVYPAIFERTKKIVEKQKQAFDASHKIMEFPIGSHVMIKVIQKTDKLDPNYIGTYTVVRKTSAGTYVLENEKKEIEPKTYPPSLLKLAPQNESFDDEYFDVEAIISHKKLDNNTYLYKCRWKGYDSSHDTYEPAENFTDPKYIAEYWKKIGVIPEGLKERNKADKKLLKTLKNSTVEITSKKRRRNTLQSNNNRSKKTKRTI